VFNLFVNIWCYMRIRFCKMIQQYNEITTQTQYNIFNVQLDDNTDMIPITGLHELTIMMLSVLCLQEGMHDLKPAQACCSLQTPFCFFFYFCENHICAFPCRSVQLRRKILSIVYFKEDHLQDSLTQLTDTTIYLKLLYGPLYVMLPLQ